MLTKLLETKYQAEFRREPGLSPPLDAHDTGSAVSNAPHPREKTKALMTPQHDGFTCQGRIPCSHRHGLSSSDLGQSRERRPWVTSASPRRDRIELRLQKP